MKRIICLALVLIILLIPICGCELGAKTASLEKRRELPEDGIISASVMGKLKDENKVATFFGESEGIKYEWTVFGSDIDVPADTNLAVEVLGEADSELAFRLRSETELGFAPVLSIYPTRNWNAGSALVYLRTGNGMSELCSASVTGSRETALNFSVTHIGTFVIRAEGVEPDADPTGDVTAWFSGESSAGRDEEPNGTIENCDPSSTAGHNSNAITPDPYVSLPTDSGGRVLSDGKQEGQDQYQTDPVPEGKPLPVEPEDQNIDVGRVFTCTLEIECSTIFNNLDDLSPEKLDVLPKDGIIFPKSTVEFYEGESVFDVLQRVCRENGIHMEASWTPIYNSVYIEGINNLYEFDCGSGSGWMYRVNGWYPNYGCSRYSLAQGDVIEWRYTCDLGADIGGGYAVNP